MTTIAQRFETICAAHANAEAVKSDDRAWTYGDLNRRANQLARVILEQLGDTDLTVGLQVEHGVSLGLGALACLKAGKVYVPLDPGNPRERLESILTDAGVGLVLSSQAAGTHRGPAEWIGLGDVGHDMPDTNFQVAPRADDRAFLLYTSGSTGRPKGVVHLNRSVVARIADGNRLAVGPGDRLTALGTGGMNLFRALLTGATLVSLDLRRVQIDALPEWLRRERITVYHSVPTVFRHFAATLFGREKFPDLRIVNLTGETLLSSDVAAFRRHFPKHCILINGLGTTETGTFRELRIDHACAVPEGVVPVGYPVEEMEVVLLDSAGGPCGESQAGEIIVCGEHISPGYWNRPESTAERFFEFGGKPAYRTGDLGEWLPGGVLKHLGRIDFQVKVRGHRVEVGEVELALGKHPAIREAAVVGEREPDGRVTRLIGYVVMEPDRRATSIELQTFLMEHLPGYMVPAVIVTLPRLPQLPNGKVDRKALPRPESVHTDATTTDAEPVDEVEAELLAIWQEVFKRDEIKTADNFFELGGNSFSAVRIVRAIQMIFGVEESIRVVFDHPTVGLLAGFVRDACNNSDFAGPRR